jgi:hypothetical protein
MGSGTCSNTGRLPEEHVSADACPWVSQAYTPAVGDFPGGGVDAAADS